MREIIKARLMDFGFHPPEGVSYYLELCEAQRWLMTRMNFVITIRTNYTKRFYAIISHNEGKFKTKKIGLQSKQYKTFEEALELGIASSIKELQKLKNNNQL